jgi:hypothetical protein
MPGQADALQIQALGQGVEFRRSLICVTGLDL